MGNNNSQESSKLIQLYQQYQPQKRKDDQFGDCTVLVNKKNGKDKLILKEYTYTDEEIFNKNKKNFETKQQTQNQYLLKILDIYTIQDQQMCSQFYKIYLLIEHPSASIGSIQLNQQDYWAVLFGYVRALEALQLKDIQHQHLNKNTLYLPPKICDPGLYEQSTNYQLLFSSNKINDIYLSPQQTQGLRQKYYQPQHNPYKSDVFILGMCMMQAILKTSMNECYKQSYLVEEVLKQKLFLLNAVAQPQLVEVLQSMLQIQETQRFDFIQLSQFLDQKYSESLQNNFKQQLGQFNSCDNQPNSTQNSQQILQHQAVQSIQPTQQNQINLPLQQQQPSMPAIKQIKSSKSNAKKPSLREIITEPSNSNSTIASRLHIQEESLIPSLPDQYDFLPQQQLSYLPSLPSNPDENIDQNDGDVGQTSRSQNQEQLLLPLKDQTEQHNNRNFQLRLSEINVKESQQQFSLPFDLPQQQAMPHISGFSSQGEIFVNEQYQDGSRYNGYKFNGMRHGQGVFYYKDGGYYDGNWQFNHMHGYGTLYYSNGTPAYKGSWNQDKFQGFGILFNEMPAQLNDPYNYKDFDFIEDFWKKYEGEFNDDNKEGQGTLYLSNGERFSGQFLKDYINGFGLFYTKQNTVIEGKWQNNKLIA